MGSTSWWNSRRLYVRWFVKNESMTCAPFERHHSSFPFSHLPISSSVPSVWRCKTHRHPACFWNIFGPIYENVHIYLFFKQILHSRHCARCFTSFKKNLFNNSVKPLVIFLIYVWESWASEKLNNLAEVTHNSYLQCITLPLRNIAHLHLWACMFERDMVSF